MDYYKGIFVRDYLSDKGEVPSNVVNPTCSPDIIPYQGYILTPSEAERSYDKYIDYAVQQEMPNNIYVRAINKGEQAMQAKARAYCAPLNVLYQPKQWTQLKTTGDQTEVPFVCQNDTKASGIDYDIAPGKVALIEQPFYMQEVKNPYKHHCLFALVSNPDGTWLKLQDDFKNNEILWKFLKEHKQFANKNIIIERPFEHTETQIVSFGNYDEKERKFNLIVKFTNGIDTMEKTTVRIQSTHAACSFTKEFTVTPNQSIYSCEYTVPPRFFGSLTVSCIMPKPKQVECSYAVRNYLLSDNSDNIKYHTKIKHRLSENEDKGERLGDYAMILTQNVNKQDYCLRALHNEGQNITETSLQNEIYEFDD